MAEPVKAKVVEVQNYSKRKGIGKNGKEWNIMTIVARTEANKDIVADTFDKVEVGSIVVLEYDEKYDSTKAKLYRANSQEERINELYKMVQEIHAVVVAPEPAKTADEQTVEDLQDIGW
jgi:hypothetical protein